MSYYDIYQKRLKRFGSTYQEKLQTKRSLTFQKYREQSGYKVSFQKGTNTILAVLEPNKQDETKTTGYLLTDLNIALKNGEIYSIANDSWMIFYLDKDISRGYNKYIVLKMTHNISCTGKNWSPCKAYYFGNMSSVIKNLTRSLGGSIYEEQDKNNHIIMPYQNLSTDDYIRVSNLDGTEINEDFLVTGFDQVSVPGVIYVTINQTIKRNEPTIETKDKSIEWLER